MYPGQDGNDKLSAKLGGPHVLTTAKADELKFRSGFTVVVVSEITQSSKQTSRVLSQRHGVLINTFTSKITSCSGDTHLLVIKTEPDGEVTITAFPVRDLLSPQMRRRGLISQISAARRDRSQL